TIEAAGTDLNDPEDRSSLGTIVCTADQPSNGFCSGTLTIGGSNGKAVCMLHMNSQEPVLTCSAQRPGNTTKAVGIVATVQRKAVLRVEVPAMPASVANINDEELITVTLTNM